MFEVVKLKRTLHCAHVAVYVFVEQQQAERETSFARLHYPASFPKHFGAPMCEAALVTRHAGEAASYPKPCAQLLQTHLRSKMWQVRSEVSPSTAHNLMARRQGLLSRIIEPNWLMGYRVGAYEAV